MIWSVAMLLGIALVGIQFVIEDSWVPFNHPMIGKVIAIDAGHGGIDGGAVAETGVLEKNIALAISLRLREVLEQAGAVVVMTREGDYDLAGSQKQSIRRRKAEDLIRRAEVVNQSEADCLISIHLNSIPSIKWSGAQSFYTIKNQWNETLAKHIQSELREQLENTNREAKEIKDVFLLRAVKLPTTLVEVGFLSNPTERKQLESLEYQDKLAEAIYRGLIRYFEERETK